MYDNILVVAHPDDEILFFSSILNKVDLILVCFSKSEDNQITNGREKLIKKYPLKNIIFLGIEESFILNSINWNSKKKIGNLIPKRNYRKFSYNNILIENKLIEFLSNSKNIYTHNFWGEYGHEEHIQISNIIFKICKKLNLKLFVSTYYSNKSYNFLNLNISLLSNKFQKMKIDKNFCDMIKKYYLDCNCWTWNNDYIWPSYEYFCEIDLFTSDSNLNDQGLLTHKDKFQFIEGEFRIPFVYFLLINFLPSKLKKFLRKIFI